MHGGAAHDDALVPNIDDIPGEQGYVQMEHMHTLCIVLVERWARDEPEMGHGWARKLGMGSYGMI